MHLERLPLIESRIVGEALRAAADGPFFPDDIFQTLFGLGRSEVRRIAEDWPLPIHPIEEVETAANNSLNNLLGYPHRMDAVWSEWISVDAVTLRAIFYKLRGR